MKRLTGVHFLFTYRCSASCDHCFVWGDLDRRGKISHDDILHYLDSAEELGSINSIFIEGGEPFLFYDDLITFVRECVDREFPVSVLTNGFWARTREIAREKLRPLAEIGLNNLGLSTDEFHAKFVDPRYVENAIEVANELGITAYKMVSKWEKIVFRGRAAEVLSPIRSQHNCDKTVSWESCTACVREALDHPKRLHLDQYGFLHLCQGLVIGNAKEKSLKEITQNYSAETHPIIAVLRKGGPAELAKIAQESGFKPQKEYADECHLCYDVRNFLRDQYPSYLCPDEMYGITTK